MKSDSELIYHENGSPASFEVKWVHSSYDASKIIYILPAPTQPLGAAAVKF